MRKTLKLLLGLAIGMLVGLCIGFAIAMIFTDITASDFIGRLGSLDILSMGSTIILSTVALIATGLIQIILHESGHLAGGLLSGYRFVSFRIFSLTLFRRNGRWMLQRFSLAGTGGQCIMTPPDLPYRQVPFILYNAGGAAFNIITVATAAIIMATTNTTDSAFAFMYLFFTIITGLWFALINGIPMKINGITNDAYNILLLWRNPESRRHFVLQLRCNALCQNGIRPKDMPAEWFAEENDTPVTDAMHACTRLMAATRLLDTGDTTGAHAMLDNIVENSGSMPELIINEASIELIFTSLISGHTEKAREMLTPKLTAYIRNSAHTISSKQRVLCSMALYLDNDPGKANDIYRHVCDNRNKYLMQGEVAMDIELMQNMLRQKA